MQADSDLLETICKAFESGMRLRSLIVTKAGYVGAVPHGVQSNDLICVLFGCSVPVVLRKRSHEESYVFLGECYLHGFMDAEAIVSQIKGIFEVEDLLLR